MRRDNITEEKSYWIIIHPKTNRVWAKHGVHFWSAEDAEKELEAEGGAKNGWQIEKKTYWGKSKKDDDF